MTKLIKRLILLLLLGVIFFAAPNFIGHQGYVLISLGQYTIEGTVISYLVVTSLTLLALYAVWLLIKYLFVFVILPSKWLNKRSDTTNANYFQAGLDNMAIAQWHQASEQFLKVKRLAKIEAAQQLALTCAIRSEDQTLISSVQKRLEGNDVESLLTKLVILYQQKQYQQAQEELRQSKVNLLKQTLPFQQLWLTIQLHNFEWDNVKKQLPAINRQVSKFNDPAVEKQWQHQLTDELLSSFQQYVKQKSLNQLEQVWQQLGKSIQKMPAVLSAYIRAIAEHQQTDTIEQLLLQDKKLSDDLLLDNIRYSYQHLKRVHMDQLFIHIQKKIKQSPENKQLLTCYAYLAAGQKDHQLAKQALEQVIFSSKHQQDTILYANVLAELGEVRHSIEVFQNLFLTQHG